MSTWTGTNKNSSSWTGTSKTVGSGTESLLLEDGFYLLTEDGFHLILDQSVAGALSWTGTNKS